MKQRQTERRLVIMLLLVVWGLMMCSCKTRQRQDSKLSEELKTETKRLSQTEERRETQTTRHDSTHTETKDSLYRELEWLDAKGRVVQRIRERRHIVEHRRELRRAQAIDSTLRLGQSVISEQSQQQVQAQTQWRHSQPTIPSPPGLPQFSPWWLLFGLGLIAGIFVSIRYIKRKQL